MRHEVTRKKEEKDEKDIGELFEREQRKKVSINCLLKTIYIIVKWKAFCMQRTQEPSCARKGTVDIDILIASRNGHRTIMYLLQ